MEFMKMMRYFSSVYDISTLKHPFHSISDVERSAYFSSTETNIETRKSQSFPIVTKIMRYFSPAYDISMVKHPFHSISHAERSAYVSQRQNMHRDSQIAIIRRL